MKLTLVIFLLLIAHILEAQNISTFAGGGSTLGDGGPATSALLENPNGGIFDKYGNYYCASRVQNRIRKINSLGIITTVAGNGSSGFTGDGGAATAATTHDPEGLSLDSYGNIYFCDAINHRVRKVDAATGIISTIAGTGIAGYNGDGILATTAQINDPIDICIDKSDNIYICDNQNNRIRKIDKNTHKISTYAGNGTNGYSGDNGLATLAQLWLPLGIACDGGGNVYVADWSNKRIRKINNSGIISTIAGTSTGYLFNGDNILATTAQIDPNKICVDKFGNVFFADWLNYRVRRVDSRGIISTVAGIGTSGFSGDGGPATLAQFSYTSGICLDSCGNLYIPEANNNRVRKVTYSKCNYLNVDESISSLEMTVFPNPVVDVLHLVNNTNSQTYLLLSLAGSIYQQGTLHKGNNTISLLSLPPGMYLLECIDEERQKTITKIVKQ